MLTTSNITSKPPTPRCPPPLLGGPFQPQSTLRSPKLYFPETQPLQHDPLSTLWSVLRRCPPGATQRRRRRQRVPKQKPHTPSNQSKLLVDFPAVCSSSKHFGHSVHEKIKRRQRQPAPFLPRPTSIHTKSTPCLMITHEIGRRARDGPPFKELSRARLDWTCFTQTFVIGNSVPTRRWNNWTASSFPGIVDVLFPRENNEKAINLAVSSTTSPSPLDKCTFAPFFSSTRRHYTYVFQSVALVA